EEGGHVLRLVVEAAEAEGGVLGEQAERLGAGAEVGVAALGGGLAGLDDAAHPGSRGWGTEKATAWRAKKAETRHFARPVQPVLSGTPSRTRGRPRRPASGVGPIRPVRARSPCPLSPTAPAAPSSARSASAPSPRPSPSPPRRRRRSRSRSATPTRPSRRHLPRARCFARPASARAPPSAPWRRAAGSPAPAWCPTRRRPCRASAFARRWAAT